MASWTWWFAAGGISVAMVAWSCLKRRQRLDSERLRSGKRFLRLLDFETSYIMMYGLASTTTVTFYEGEIDEEALRKRVRKITAKNPWLGGRLVTDDNGNVGLAYGDPNWEAGILKILDGAEDENLAKFTKDTPYDMLSKTLERANLAVKLGSQILNKDENVFQFSLVKQTSVAENKGEKINSKFAIVTSLCHCVGDGRTFYRIRNMLDLKTKIVSLDATRIPDRIFVGELRAALGREESNIVTSWGVVLNHATGLLMTLIKGKAISRLFKVNMDWVKSQKKIQIKAGNKDVPYVSTNDIVTSWFFSSIKAEFGFMAIDMREKIPLFKPGLAGNYENTLVYLPEDFKNPELIRRSIKLLKRAGVPITQLPVFPGMWRGRAGLITNWASFYEDVEFPNCNQIVHFPIYDARVIPDTMALGVIFRPKPGELAFLTLSQPSMTASMLDSDATHDFKIS
ncbi:hypothetical protein AAMO2058_000035500 [Amorphochlora amoebiformis]